MGMRRRPDITELSFDKKVEALAGFAASKVSPFRDRSSADQEKRKARAAEDFFFFARTYLPHYFESEPGPMHRELVDMALAQPDPAAGVILRTFAAAAPTGSGKSVLISFAFTLWEVVTGRTDFTIVISETADLAEDHVASIGAELTENRRITFDFPLRLVRLRDGDLVVAKGPRVYARGAGQQLRGLKHKSARPDRIVLDDMESDESAKNPKRIKKLLDWISGTVMSRFGKTGRLDVIGTIIDRRSALATILHSKDEPWCYWTRKVFQAIRPDGTSFWPARFPIEDLEALKRTMGTIAFEREKQNNPRDPEAMFQEEWIRTYHPADLRRKALQVAAWFDPSVGSGESHDYKALVVLGLDPAEMAFYVLDAWVKQASLDAAYQAIIQRQLHWRAGVIGVEDNLFQALVINELVRAAKKAKVILPLRGVTSHQAKETRISGLSPLVERGVIRFAPDQGDQAVLIEQLLFFPSATVHDDAPDALAGAASLLDCGVGEVAYETVQPGRAASFGRGAW